MNCTAIRAEDGRRITLPQPVGLELKCTCSSPRPPGNANLRNRDALAAAGATSNRTVRKAHAPLFRRNRRTGFFLRPIRPPRDAQRPLPRRCAAGLRALPASYNQPDLQAIFLLHAAPYGLSSVRGEGRCPGVYQVGKGQSEWEVLTDFCAYVCGWQPRVTKRWHPGGLSSGAGCVPPIFK